MIWILIAFGTAGLAVSLAFTFGAIKWTLRQVNIDDCCNWDDCL